MIKLTPQQIEELVSEKEAELNAAEIREQLNGELRTLILKIRKAGFWVNTNSRHRHDDDADGDEAYAESFRVY